MKKVFLDTDIILDLLLERKPFNLPSMLVFEKAEKSLIDLNASAVTFTNLFYILGKSYSYSKVYSMLNEVCISVNILNVDSKIIKHALLSENPDFEDSVQKETAVANGMDVILTRNIKDYKDSIIPVMNADEFLKSF